MFDSKGKGYQYLGLRYALIRNLAQYGEQIPLRFNKLFLPTWNKMMSGETKVRDLETVHRRIKRRSQVAAVAFGILTIVFLGLSYFTNFIVFEIDSIVAFVATIIVLLTERSSTVQLRVVTMLMTSYEHILNTIGEGKPVQGNVYVPRGDKLTDVFVLPKISTGDDVDQNSQNDPQIDVSNGAGLPPLGAGLAELYLREIGINKPTVDDILTGIPSVISEKLRLSSRAAVQNSGNTIKATFFNPLIRIKRSTLGSQLEEKNLLSSCPIGSMLAVLLSFASKQEVVLQRCDYDEGQDSLVVLLQIVSDSQERITKSN